MPRGSPKPQTIASHKWHKKAGYKTKGFCLRGDIAERFKNACENANRSQASVVQMLMERFISGEEGQKDNEQSSEKYLRDSFQLQTEAKEALERRDYDNALDLLKEQIEKTRERLEVNLKG